MNNVMLDPLPSDWMGYAIDSDFRIGIQIHQILEDRELSKTERIMHAGRLLFPGAILPPEEQAEALEWYMTAWDHDRHKRSKDTVRVLDYDIDQWRLYSAFRSQYGINLNTIDSLHYWEFMGLLTTLDECAFTRVIDIRVRKKNSKMSKEEVKALEELKAIYALEQAEQEETPEQRAERENAIKRFEELRKANS